MRERTLIQIAAGLTVVVWAGVVIVHGAKFDLSLLGSLGTTGAIVAVIVTAFDRFGWRLPLVSRLFRRHRPLVRGTWQGEARSSRQDEPFYGFLVIDQTVSHVSVRMLTDDGSSETLTSSWDKSDDQNPAIFYVWRRFPSGEHAIQARSDSPTYIHYGAGVLEVCGDSPFQLRGLYWTIEGVTGEMDFSSRKGKLCKSYDEAVALFGQ